MVGTTSLWAQRNWLTQKMSGSDIASYADQIEQWRDHQKTTIFRQLAALSNQNKTALIDRAEADLDFEWPNLPATAYLEFYKNGNRSHYQSMRGKRRSVLSTLVIAELLENKGRFIPQIVNGIWAICEESTWAYPAHLSLQHNYTPLPQPGEPTVDLGAAGTAALMSWVHLLLGTKLAEVSEVIPQRIAFELNNRIIAPYLNRTDYWWMGLHGQRVNNWNPWVNQRVLLTALLVENKTEDLVNILHKTARSVDYFINQYPDDGGCDEGPSYWSMAGAALIHYLQLLKSVTNGTVDITDHALIGRMGAYIYKLHIDRNEFVDFADAHRYTIPDIAAVYTYGTVCRNDTLKQFAAYLAHLSDDFSRLPLHYAGNLNHFINYIAIQSALATTPAKAPFTQHAWLPDLQVLTARSRAGTPAGLFVAAKGGTNGESHNHNDIGNFVIYADGQPAIIDVGVGTYTRQTFSKDRYKLFTMQSAWHNLPTINGFMQHQGKTYHATDVRFQKKKDKISLSMDLSDAYPKEAAIDQWVRKLEFNGKKVTLTESYHLTQIKKPVVLSLISPLNVTTDGDNLLLTDSSQHAVLRIHYDSKQFEVAIEKKVLKDPSLIHSWSGVLNRIHFAMKNSRLQDSYSIRFEKP